MSENTGITPEPERSAAGITPGWLRSFTTGTRTMTSPLPGLKHGDIVHVTVDGQTREFLVADFKEQGREVQLMVEPASQPDAPASR